MSLAILGLKTTCYADVVDEPIEKASGGAIIAAGILVVLVVTIAIVFIIKLIGNKKDKENDGRMEK